MVYATGIKTELGNRILRSLVDAGWRLDYAYPDDMVDKGLDYDKYRISNAAERIEFEWDNWEEWQIRGTPSAMRQMCQQFGIESHSDPSTK